MARGKRSHTGPIHRIGRVRGDHRTRVAEKRQGRPEHRSRTLARRHDRGRQFCRWQCSERCTDQRPGGNGIDAGPKDALTVVTKLEKRTAQ